MQERIFFIYGTVNDY